MAVKSPRRTIIHHNKKVTMYRDKIKNKKKRSKCRAHNNIR